MSMNNNFHVWFDPKKYPTGINGELKDYQNGVSHSHSDPVMNSYYNNDQVFNN